MSWARCWICLFFFWRILLNGGGKTAICVEGFLNLLWPGCRDRSLPAAKDVTGSGRMDRWDSPENLIDCCRRCCVSLMGVTRWIDLSSRVIFGVQSIVSRSWILPSPLPLRIPGIPATRAILASFLFPFPAVWAVKAAARMPGIPFGTCRSCCGISLTPSSSPWRKELRPLFAVRSVNSVSWSTLEGSIGSSPGFLDQDPFQDSFPTSGHCCCCCCCCCCL